MILAGVVVSDRLNRDEFVDSAPSVRGEQIHIHHCKGGKGNDKLYVRRNEDDSIVAYCHHCNKRGYARDNYVPHIYDQLEGSSRSSGVGNSNTEARDEILGRFKAETESVFTSDSRFRTQTWVVRSKLTEKILDKMQARVVDSRIWFPLYTPSGDIAVLCGRGYDKVDPKWLIYKYNGGEDVPTSTHKVPNMVLVEDIISAQAIDNAGYNAYPLLGTSIPTFIVSYISKHPELWVTIWLDNDNSQVLSNRLKIYHRIKLVTDRVGIVKVLNQPKEMSQVDIFDAVIDSYPDT